MSTQLLKPTDSLRTSQADTPQTIIVTGAAGGMGRQCCQYFAQLGWHVLAIDHNQARLAVLASEQISTLCIDLADVNLAQHVLKELTILPPVWGLVNLAGISQGSTIDELSEADWQRSFAVNVDPVFRLIQAVSPQMKANGGGSIINVSSPVGYIGARKPSYAASKAALHGLTMSCARNLGEFNIRVNLLLPGTTITEMTKDWSVERQQAIAEESWLKRLCTPQEIAESIAFLLSEHSRYMTGSVLDMTCGSMCGH